MSDNISSTPFFSHDCPCCTFLGARRIGWKREDMYVCKEGTDEATLIRRYSDKDSDYSAVPVTLAHVATVQDADWGRVWRIFHRRQRRASRK